MSDTTFPVAENQGFPKMVYNHPKDKTKEHKHIVVKSPEELKDALHKGYKEKPHIPVQPKEKQFEGDEYEAGGVTAEAKANQEGVLDHLPKEAVAKTISEHERMGYNQGRADKTDGELKNESKKK